MDKCNDIRLQRQFLPAELKVQSWKDVEPFFLDLEKRELNSVGDIEQWLFDSSELTSVLQEEQAWRYIRVSCNTEDEQLAEAYNYFVTEVSPKVSEYSNILDRKLYDSPLREQLDKDAYFVLLRGVKKQIEIFREENIPLIAELQTLRQDYGKITGAMSIQYKDKEHTLQQAGNYLKETDRVVRRDVYELIAQRRLQDTGKLNDLMTTLTGKREVVAANAGYENYRDYRFDSLQRFDYTTEDCFAFHESVSHEVLPIVKKMHEARRQKLGLDQLRPWDLDVDPEMKPPLKPFSSIDELVDKSIRCLSRVRPSYGDYLQVMKECGFLDLDSRKGKAPGGYNYPLYESNIPFIFMNATSNLRDLETMMHEAGHAIHAFLCKDIRLVAYKDTPAEVAELASMAMELLSMEHWDVFFPNPEDLRRAKRAQLEGILSILPWVATVDKFQHWIYTHPNHTAEERNKAWTEVYASMSTEQVQWEGFENVYKTLWQRQLHIFEIPFYYIEYGIAQLGAVAIWKNYKQNPGKAIDAYEDALKLGYTVPIPEIYKTAGIRFDFSREYIRELMQFVKEEMERL